MESGALDPDSPAAASVRRNSTQRREKDYQRKSANHAGTDSRYHTSVSSVFCNSEFLDREPELDRVQKDDDDDGGMAVDVR